MYLCKKWIAAAALVFLLLFSVSITGSLYPVRAQEIVREVKETAEVVHGLIISKVSGHGVLVKNTGKDGVHVNTSGKDGFYVYDAGGASNHISDTLASGFEVAGSAGSGVFIGSTDKDGIHIKESGLEGVDVANAARDGFEVDNAGQDGLHIGTVGDDGVHISNAGDDGIHIGNAGDNGVRIKNASRGMTIESVSQGVVVESAYTAFNVGTANGFGLYVGSSDYEGVRISHANDSGLAVASAGLDALRVWGVDKDGVKVCHTGNSEGSCTGIASNNGIEALYTEDYSGYFYKDIYVRGACQDCIITTFGINEGSGIVKPGDILTVSGINDGDIANREMLLGVQPATEKQTIIGVAGGWAELVTPSDPTSEEMPVLVPRGGPVEPGGYLNIITHGPVQVRASALGGAIQSGDKLTINSTGAARIVQSREVEGLTIQETASTVGIALEGLGDGQEGLIWVLVNPQ